MSSLTDYHNYLESDDEVYYRLRMGYDWDEESFQNMIRLINKVLEEYKGADVIPKSIVYFFVNEVERIVGLVTNPLFHKNPPAPFTSESYKAYIEERVDVLKEMKRRFLSGEI